MMLSFIAVPRWLNFPLGAIQVLATPEDIASLTFEVLETGRVGDAHQMAGAKDGFAVAKRIGGMNVALTTALCIRPSIT